jgi:cytochrome c oxidase assembly protein subunit 11
MKLSRNDTVLLSCVAGVVAMVGLSYAAVPLYYAFCRATGYGGTPSRADAAPAASQVLGRRITIRFDSNVDPALGWSFQPDTRSMTVKIGENRLAFFRARNEESVPVVGHATFNVTPERAAIYFAKIQCFCFTEQKLEPGQTVEMPVSFFVDPAILDDPDARDVTEITLSYTFYPSVKQAVAPTARPHS